MPHYLVTITHYLTLEHEGDEDDAYEDVLEHEKLTFPGFADKDVQLTLEDVDVTVGRPL